MGKKVGNEVETGINYVVIDRGHGVDRGHVGLIGVIAVFVSLGGISSQ